MFSKLTKEKEIKIDIRQNDFVAEIASLEGPTPEQKGKFVDKIYAGVKRLKESAKRKWKSNVNVDTNGIMLEI